MKFVPFSTTKVIFLALVACNLILGLDEVETKPETSELASVPFLTEIAKLAARSYCTILEFEDLSRCKSNCKYTDTTTILHRIKLNDEDILSYIVADFEKKHIYIVTRGSVSDVNWGINFNDGLVKYHNRNIKDHVGEGIHKEVYELHKGYREVGAKLYTDIEETLLELFKKDVEFELYKIYVVGHSLGGSLSQYIGLNLKLDSKFKYLDLNLNVISFGQPRIFNPDLAHLYTKIITNSVRIVNENDLIPSLPPVLKGYRHGSTQYNLFNGTLWKLNPIDSEQDTFIPEKFAGDDHFYFNKINFDNGCGSKVNRKWINFLELSLNLAKSQVDKF